MKTYLKGFTLVEIIVFTGIMGVMMVGLVGVLLNSLRARNRSRLEDLVDFNGTWVGEQMKWNLLNATYGSVNCNSEGAGTVRLENRKDNTETIIGCQDNRIASSSGANKVYLSSEEVTDNCGNGSVMEVKCVDDLTGQVAQVEIGYQISNTGEGGSWEDKVTKNFKTKVVIRP